MVKFLDAVIGAVFFKLHQSIYPFHLFSNSDIQTVGWS